MVDSVALNTTATGIGGFVSSTGGSYLDLLGSNVTGASGLLGGMGGVGVGQCARQER